MNYHKLKRMVSNGYQIYDALAIIGIDHVYYQHHLSSDKKNELLKIRKSLNENRESHDQGQAERFMYNAY